MTPKRFVVRILERCMLVKTRRIQEPFDRTRLDWAGLKRVEVNVTVVVVRVASRICCGDGNGVRVPEAHVFAGLGRHGWRTQGWAKTRPGGVCVPRSTFRVPFVPPCISSDKSLTRSYRAVPDISNRWRSLVATRIQQQKVKLNTCL